MRLINLSRFEPASSRTRWLRADLVRAIWVHGEQRVMVIIDQTTNTAGKSEAWHGIPARDLSHANSIANKIAAAVNAALTQAKP